MLTKYEHTRMASHNITTNINNVNLTVVHLHGSLQLLSQRLLGLRDGHYWLSFWPASFERLTFWHQTGLYRFRCRSWSVVAAVGTPDRAPKTADDSAAGRDSHFDLEEKVAYGLT